MPGAMSPDSAEHFRTKVLFPALLSANIDAGRPSTWHTGEKYHAAFEISKANNNRYGAHVGLPGGVQPPEELFAEGGRLRRAVDELLLTPGGEATSAGAAEPRYTAPAPDARVGSVVLRYPQEMRRTHFDRFVFQLRRLCGAGSTPLLGWHVDGRGWHHHLHSAGQALVALPVYASAGPSPGCGGTAVVSGSHVAVASMLYGSRPYGLSYGFLFFIAHLLAWAAQLPLIFRCPLAWFCSCSWLVRLRLEEVVGCVAGDVLLMHPFLAHSSSENVNGSELRIAQNVCIRWSSDLDLTPFLDRAGTGLQPDLVAAAVGRPVPSEVELTVANAILRPHGVSAGSALSHAHRFLCGWHRSRSGHHD